MAEKHGTLPSLSGDEWFQAVQDAHGVRAAFYHAIFTQVRADHGQEYALELIGRVCRSMGEAKGPRYRSALPDDRVDTFCAFFCSHSPVSAAVFDMHDRTNASDGETDSGVVELRRCALVEAWRAQGVSDDDIALLCSAAREIDHGTLAGVGLEGTFERLIAEGADCCRLRLRRGPPR